MTHDKPNDDDYNAQKDFANSLNECYRVIRERMAAGGPGWVHKAPSKDNK